MVVVRTRQNDFIRRNQMIVARVLVSGRINGSHVVLDLLCLLRKIATRSGGIALSVKLSDSGFVSAEHSDLWMETRNDIAKNTFVRRSFVSFVAILFAFTKVKDDSKSR